MRGSRAVLVKFNNYAYSFPLGHIQEIKLKSTGIGKQEGLQIW